jgi:uncharacterized protein
VSEARAGAPIVTVRGQAEREVPPDLAELMLTVNAAGDSAARVRSELAVGSGRLAEVLERFAAAIERSSMGTMHVGPVFNPRSPSRITGYRGSFHGSVVLHDFSVLSDLVYALAPIPSSQLNGPWWSLRRNHPAYREVRLDAIADARRRADDYAGAFGARVAALIEVSDLEPGFAGREAMMPRAAAFRAGAAEPEFQFEPAGQVVSGQVTVRFAIGEVDLDGGSG